MREIGSKFVSFLVVILFGWVVFREFIGPPAARQGLKTGSTEQLTLANSERIFLELGGTPGAVPVVVFVTDWCSVCRALEETLRKLQVPFARADVEDNRRAAMYYQVLTRGQTSGVPVTLVGTKLFLGYDMNGIAAALREFASRPEST